MKLANKQDCTGCAACYNACHKQCIQMKVDAEGFKYPHIDGEMCIECGACVSACPLLSGTQVKESMRYAVGLYLNDKQMLEKSASGGAFALFADYVLEEGGAVFGAALDKHFNVKHIAVYTKQELEPIKKSKYVQSDIGDSYIQAKKLLEEGKLVLFTGTGCQIAGLKQFLKKDYEKLLTLDLICYGVPSDTLWKAYVQDAKSKYGDIDKITFRVHAPSWADWGMKYNVERNTEKIIKFPEDPFCNIYLTDTAHRYSCYNCRYRNILNRQSDATMGDFWGMENIKTTLDDKNGVSILFIHSQKLFNIFNEIKDRTKYEAVDFWDAAAGNSGALGLNQPVPQKRAALYEDLMKMQFDDFSSKYATFQYKQASNSFKSFLKKFYIVRRAVFVKKKLRFKKETLSI